MKPLTLFDLDPIPPSVPVDTSEDAALKKWPTAGTDRAKLMELYVAAGETGLTDSEIAALHVVGVNSLRARRGELEDMELIVRTLERRRNSLGNLCVVFKVRQ